MNSTCSNGNFDDACSNGSGAFKQAGNAGTKIIAPMIYINGTCEQNGGTVVSPVTEGAGITSDPMAGLHGPRQSDYPAGHCPRRQGSMIVYDQMTPTDPDGCPWNRNGTTVTLTPGVYWGGWNFSGNSVTVRLQPGIYIIAGGGASIRGSAAVDSTPAVIGGDPAPGTDPARVLIFSTDNTMDPACADDIALAARRHPIRGALRAGSRSACPARPACGSGASDSGPVEGTAAVAGQATAATPTRRSTSRDRAC